MIKEIDGSAAYVTGALRSALYDFETGKVYSINPEGTRILSDFLAGGRVTAEGAAFLEQIRGAAGLALERVSDYEFPPLPAKLDLAWLELTQRCNFRCVHCYQGACHEEETAPLSVDEWKEVILQCAAADCRQLQLIGGEPGLCPFLPELIRFARGAGIRKLFLFSNLFFMPEDLLAAVTDCGVQVNFSIYGSRAEVHDRITQVPGSFDRLVSRVTRLRDLRVPLRANIVLMRENEGELEPTKAYLRELGVTSFHYDEIRKVYGGAQSPHMPANPVLKLKRPNFRTDRAAFERNRYANSCWHGRLSVSTDGTVYPCEFERNIVYGNVRQASLPDILAGEAVRRYWYLSFDHITLCRDCEYRFACRDCRPMAYAERGRMTDQNPRCCYDPASGRWDGED